MENNKLEELEQITNRINNNLNNIVNTAKTSDLNKLLNDVNKDLEKQNQLRQETGIDKATTSNEKISSINSKLKEQQRLLQKINVDQASGFGNIERSAQSFNNTTRQTARTFSYYNRGQMETYSTLQRQGTYQTTPSDPSLAFEYFAVKNRKRIAKGLAEFAEFFGPIGKLIGLGIEATVEAFEQLLAIIKDIISTTTKFADKFQEFVSVADESVRSTLQALGYVMTENFGDKTKTDRIVKNILDASNYLVQTVGIAFGPEKVAEFQKAYAEISKTSLSFHSTDLATMAEVQTVLDLSAQQTAEFTNLFVQMGASIDTSTDFMKQLFIDSNQVGISTKKVVTGLKEYFKSSELFKFGNDVMDLSRIASYAHRMRIDIAGMLKLMNKVSDPEKAIDLAAQLQALDTAFLGIDPIDFMGAAMTDIEKFSKMVTDPLLEHISDFYNIQTGQLTQRGRGLTDNIMQLEGMGDVFKSQKDFVDFLAKGAKEKEIRNALYNSITSYASLMQLTPKEQENIIGLLAEQAQITADGIKITTLEKDISQLTPADMKLLMESGFEDKKTWEEAAAGTVSIADQEQENKLLVASMSSTVDAIGSVHELLRDGELIQTLQDAGRIINEIGMYYFKDTFFKQLDIMVDTMGLTMAEAYTFQQLMGTGETFDKFTSGFKGVMQALSDIGGGVFGIESWELQPEQKSKGGLINISTIKFPKPAIQAYSKYITPKTNSLQLSNILQLFNTSKTGSGVISTATDGSMNIIISGEIRNYINDKDAGVLSNEKVYEILEKNLTK